NSGTLAAVGASLQECAVMHPSVMDFARRHLGPHNVSARSRVLEVGAYNVNGSVREHIETLAPAVYLGVDIEEGPGVDMIADCEQLTGVVGSNRWAIIICTEMLEHTTDWQQCMRQIVAAMARGGDLLLTTRSPGFPLHEFPQDCWRFTKDDMA